MTMDKPAIVRAVLVRLDDEIRRATESADRTRQGAIHEEAKPENDKDTRALEASYLARGQAQRVVDLESARKRVQFMELRTFGDGDAIDLSALVQVVDSDDGDDSARWYFLAPAGGGHRVEVGGVTIDVLTPEAPLGRALIGKLPGDDVQLRLAGRMRELEIAQLR
jgi:transcription elongation GreA/GreB family factor